MAKERNDPFNPLDKRSLGLSVANAILDEPIGILPPTSFGGIGVYALYYQGTNPAYKIIADYNRKHPGGWPVYVGKAIASGGRKGVLSDVTTGNRLYNRLRKHASSIDAAENLDLSDFSCRYLIVDSIWIPLGEQLLIEKYKPIWNSVVDGFGNNDPGKGRHAQQISAWDSLHPGRSWAEKLARNTSFVMEEYLPEILSWQRGQVKNIQ